MGIMQKLLKILKAENDNSEKIQHITNFEKVLPEGQTIYFKNGKMYKVYPSDKESWYDARYLVSDDVLYDLETIDDINKIPIPQFAESDDVMSGYGVTGSLDYVLRMKAGAFYNRNEKELCSACLWKATELMFSSGIDWRKEDYLRIVNWHYELGMFDEARKAEKYLLSKEEYTKNIFDSCAESTKNIVLTNARKSNLDLVAFHDYGQGCCEECAKMRGRVYSISGKNKIFPKLPNYAKLHGNFHEGCRCMMSSYHDNIDSKIYYKGNSVDAITSSIRPWIDDRSDEEISLYKEYLKRQADNEKKERDRKEYYNLLELYPEIVPKSFGAYRRMKNSKTKNFMKLFAIAKEKGIVITID